MATWFGVLAIAVGGGILVGVEFRDYYVTNSASNLKITHPKAIEEQKKAKNNGRPLVQTIRFSDFTPFNNKKEKHI